jgi:hypothetical protein
VPHGIAPRGVVSVSSTSVSQTLQRKRSGGGKVAHAVLVVYRERLVRFACEERRA